MRKALLIILAASLPVTALAREHIWIIGGGPTPDDSQAQIEFNVKWVIASLRGLLPDAVVNVFFANGTGPEKATLEWRPADEGTPLQPLARVFGDQAANGNAYREHRVPGVAGSTRADSLVPELERQFDSLREGDRALIVYNGHGSWHADRAENGLRLWGESHLSVREFERLLSHINAAVPVRFILTQCYSGAFERAVHPGAADVKTLAPGRRCGFFPVSANGESEGCSASLKIGDYRDYTTYFFSALTGRTRLGEPIAGNPDLDGDGRVTPFEAHLYAIVEGYSADLPRSTSEAYLERWQPWYLRWLETGGLPDNVYGRIARQLARRNGLPQDDPGLARALELRHRDLARRVSDTEAEGRRLESHVTAIQERIQRSLSERWPETLHPYTEGFRAFLARNLADAQSFIVQHPEYPHLVAKQDRFAATEIELMDLNRKTTQLEKIRRARMLARTLGQFQRLASGRDRSAYGQLRRCEELPL